MDSGWAVVIGALAALVGSVFGPWLLEASKRKTAAEAARRSELSALIPKLFESIDSGLGRKPGETEMLVRVQLLLTATEASVGNILIIAATHPLDSDLQAVARTSVSMWFRGQKSLDEVAARFEKATGRTVRAQQ